MCVYCNPEYHQGYEMGREASEDVYGRGRADGLANAKTILRAMVDQIREREKRPYDSKPRTHNGQPDWSASILKLKNMADGIDLALEVLDGKDALAPYLE